MISKRNKTDSTGGNRWLRWLMWIGGSLLVLIVALYFVVSSGAFMKGFVLPKIGRSLGADLSVSEVRLSPFSQLALRGVKLTPTNSETLFTAESIIARYSLFSIIGGKIAVEELTVNAPTITIVENADGTSNLDPLMSGKGTKPVQPSKPAPSKTPSVDIKSISLNNVAFQQIKKFKDGSQDMTQITNLNFTLNDLGNSQSGKLDLSATFAMTKAGGTNALRSSLDGTIKAAFTFALTQDLMPTSVNGEGSFAVARATGDLEELGGLAANLSCDVAPTEVKGIALQFSKAGAALGQVRVSGPFDSAKTEGSLKFEILSLDRNILNLAGAPAGLDFGPTSINSTNEINFSSGGSLISAQGALDISRLQVTRQLQISPTLTFHCGYGLSVDRAGQLLMLKTLDLTGTQNGQQLLSGGLAGAINIGWGGDNNSIASTTGDGALNITLTNLNLEFWKAFAPEAAPEGVANASLIVQSLQGGSQLSLDLDSRIAALSGIFGGQNIKALNARVQSHVLHKRQDRTFSGQFTLSDLNGRCGEMEFNNYGAVVDFDLATKENGQIEIQKVAGRLNEGQSTGGRFEMSGDFNSKSQNGQFTLKLADINQNGVRPFLEPAFGGKKLVSLLINSTASGSFGPNGEAGLKTDLHLANLVVGNPEGATPGASVGARAQVDVAVKDHVAQVRQCVLTLTPTARASKNELNLTGKVDSSTSDAITGNLSLASDAIDLTPYYDLFSGNSTANEAKAATTTPPAASESEPEAKKLPFKDFVCDVKLEHVFLREIEAVNFQATARLDGGHVVLNPCRLALAGAPVNFTADLNLGVTGYVYDLDFDTQSVPLAPLVNSFLPDSKGQVNGKLTATAQIKGAGVTGASLQKNLKGQFSVVTTNLNLSLKDVRSRFITPVINIVVGLPDLFRNPAATLTGWLGGTKSGWADKITAAPIDVILANGNAGNGQIQLQQAEVRSAAFKAEMAGDVSIAPVLTNSTLNFPVTISLSRPLAEQVGQVTADTPTNAVYVALPNFISMAGTLGQPEVKRDNAVILQIAGRAGSGIFKGIGGAIESVIGVKPGTNSPSGSTNQTLPSLLERLIKPKSQ